MLVSLLTAGMMINALTTPPPTTTITTTKTNNNNTERLGIAMSSVGGVGAVGEPLEGAGTAANGAETSGNGIGPSHGQRPTDLLVGNRFSNLAHHVRWGIATTRAVNLAQQKQPRNNNNISPPLAQHRWVANNACCNCSYHATCRPRDSKNKRGCACVEAGCVCVCCLPGKQKCRN